MPKQTKNDKQKKGQSNTISSQTLKALPKISKIPREWR